MKTLFLVVVLVIASITACATQRIVDFTNWVNTTPGNTSITFSSGDVAFFEVPPDYISSSNVCGLAGITKCIQSDHLILKLVSTPLATLKINANSSSNSGQSRTVLSVETGFSSNGPWIETPFSATSLPTGANDDETCGIIVLSSFNVPINTYVRIVFTSSVLGVSGTTAQNVRLLQLTLSDVPVDMKQVISTDLLSKVGEVLLNPTNLEVEIYSQYGYKILTTRESSIGISGLDNGEYIAKTGVGTLKFVK